MKTIDKIITNVSGSRGAPIGRSCIGTLPTDKKIFDCLVPMLQGGYDKGGVYWGSGIPLRVSYTKDLTYINFYRAYTTKDKWFDQNGWFIGEIPENIIQDCSISGDVSCRVKDAIENLNFNVPEELREKAIEYLLEFGAWEREDLKDKKEMEIKLFWIMCCEISEQGEFIGLTH